MGQVGDNGATAGKVGGTRGPGSGRRGSWPGVCANRESFAARAVDFQTANVRRRPVHSPSKTRGVCGCMCGVAAFFTLFHGVALFESK